VTVCEPSKPDENDGQRAVTCQVTVCEPSKSEENDGQRTVACQAVGEASAS